MGADSRFTMSAGGTVTGIAAGVLAFVNGHGPYTTAATVSAAATDVTLDSASGGKAKLDFANTDFTSTAHKLPLQITKAQTVSVSAGDILALNGRRYKVKYKAHQSEVDHNVRVFRGQ